MTPVGITAMTALRATMNLQNNIVSLLEQETNIISTSRDDVSEFSGAVLIEQMQQDIAALHALVTTLRQQQQRGG